jgi:lysozyme
MSQLSERGAGFIGRFEGWRDTPYNDVANNATIGYGHLIHSGPVTNHDKTEWGTLSQAAGIHLLQRDASVALAAIEHYVTRDLQQHERDALASFAFNCGGGALNGSVGHAVNAGQDPTSALEQWDHAGGQVVQGLLRRRQEEAKLYTAGDYGDGKAPEQPVRQQTSAAVDGDIPNPVPAWAWQWVEWKLGRAEFKGHAGDPALRGKTHAPATVPPWSWKFLARFQ